MAEGQPSRAELYRLVERLVAERTGLRAENARLRAEVERLAVRVAELEAELAGRSPGGPAAPAWVKKNTPPRPKKARKKRVSHFCRPRGVATARVAHAVDACPDCGCALRGGSAKRHREVIEVALRPATVTDHVLLERVCPVCARRCVPTLGPADGVVGRHRFGPTLLALIATLHEVGRMPVRPIQAHLAMVFGVHVSLGAIADALHAVAARGAGRVDAIREEVRASPVVNSDETGWRQDGQNRYVWVVSTPTARYFAIGRRTNGQIDAVLGAAFGGILVTDFYSAYAHFAGEKQRCWAHVLREARDLADQHPDDRAVADWVRRLRRVYAAARDAPDATAPARRALRRRLELRTADLCPPSAAAVPHRKLAARLLRHLHELFTFVTDPSVPATNNRAERDLRPLVIARKVWGGTRSDRGSADAARRFTLFATWRARGLNPFEQTQQLLLSPGV